jgi:ATP-dependent helicase HrpB
LRALGLDRRGLSNVSRTVRQIGSYLPGSRALSPTRSGDVEEALEAAALSAYPDRLGRRRDAGGSEIALAAGGSARMAPESVVRTAPLLLAVDVEERRASAPGLPSRIERNATTIRLASATTAEMLFDLFPERLKWDESVEWNAEAGRVDAWETLSYEGFVIETSRMGRVDPVKAAAMLATEAGKKGIRHFADEGAIDRLLARIAFVSGTVPGAGLVLPTEAALEDALSAACEGLRSFSELRKADLAAAVAAMLPPDRRATLDRMAPERVTLEGGRTIRVTYEAGKTPFVESRLQDFFGSRTGPSVAGGRVPVVIHLLAPSMRPVQLTSDLAGFWERHYPAIRKELMRRYPKHAWPENPLEAAPPRRGR